MATQQTMNDDYPFGQTPQPIQGDSAVENDVDQIPHRNFRESVVTVRVCREVYVNEQLDCLEVSKKETSQLKCIGTKDQTTIRNCTDSDFVRAYEITERPEESSRSPIRSDDRPKHIKARRNKRECIIKRSPLKVRGNYSGGNNNPIQEAAAMHRAKENLRRAGESEENLVRRTHLMMPIEFLHSEKYLYIVMPSMPDAVDVFTHSLKKIESSDLMSDSRALWSESTARKFVPQLLEGFKSLQASRICHCDINLKSIRISTDEARDEDTLIIIDFWISLRIPYDEGNNRLLIDNRNRETCLGKDEYTIPPESRYFDKVDGHARDLFALAPILYYLLTGQKLVETFISYDEVYRHLLNGKLLLKDLHNDYRSDLPRLGAQILDFMQSALNYNPERRLSLQQMMDHEWLREYQVEKY